jgi:uncharacterized membrane protein
MKAILGLGLIVAGILFGLYAGLWWAFIGGIMDVVQAIRAPDLQPMAVAIGIAKVCFAGLIGYLSALVAIVPGYVLIKRA